MLDEADRDPTRAARRGQRAALAVLLLGLGAMAAAEEAGAGDAYSGAGAERCLQCHSAADEPRGDDILVTPHGLVADARTPLADERHQCETCHGPSKAHLTRRPDGTRPPPGRVFNRAVAAGERNAPCVGCHQDSGRMHWQSSTHALEDVACTDCHQLHVEERDPVLTTEDAAQVCFACHRRERAEFLRRSRHPVQAVGLFSRSGLLSCSDCHNPHGGVGPGELVRDTLNETCYDCHAELRGPFLWEHAPAREDCTNCHNPHGSQHEKLLSARAPWLCQQCHQAQFHPSEAISGTDVPPQGRSDLALARGCMNCHTQVHGSNHPSGMRLTR